MNHTNSYGLLRGLQFASFVMQCVSQPSDAACKLAILHFPLLSRKPTLKPRGHWLRIGTMASCWISSFWV